MADKFVVSTNDVGEIIVTDVETGKVYRRDNISNFFGLIRLLNEQQSTISRLEEENEQLRKELDNFKPIIFKNMQKGTIILYSKGDVDE